MKNQEKLIKKERKNVHSPNSHRSTTTLKHTLTLSFSQIGPPQPSQSSNKGIKNRN